VLIVYTCAGPVARPASLAKGITVAEIDTGSPDQQPLALRYRPLNCC
jgi:hypothetical protein